MAKFCVNCGKELKKGADVCISCGKVINIEALQPSGKSKVAAGLLALFFGTFGIHNFYLGYSGKGTTQLLLTIFGFLTLVIIIGALIIAAVSLWAFIEAILIFSGSINKDGAGNPLVN